MSIYYGIMEGSPVKLLWTGGWDSTFRLLDLVLNQGRAVQPYYILDRARRSAAVELETMDRIKNVICRRFQEPHRLIAKTLFVDKDTIVPNESITRRYENIKKSGHLGSQYDWLSRFVFQENLSGVDLCWQHGGRGYAWLMNSLRSDGDAMVLVDVPESPDFEIFRPFRFPVIHLSKRDMMGAAQESRFLDIMYTTHFCFRPDRKGRPCGWCNPCSFVIEEGMGHRIPWIGYFRRYSIGPVRRVASRARSLVRRLSHS